MGMEAEVEGVVVQDVEAKAGWSWYGIRVSGARYLVECLNKITDPGHAKWNSQMHHMMEKWKISRYLSFVSFASMIGRAYGPGHGPVNRV